MTEPYPLAKPKFWAESITAIGDVLADIGEPVPAACRRSIKSLITEKPEFFAITLWELGDLMRKAAWKINDRERPLHKWWQLKGYVLGDSLSSNIGKIVYIQDAILVGRKPKAVGQLIGIWHEPTGRRKYDWEDNGPLRLQTQYHLRLLDGTDMRWTNASYGIIPTIRTIAMFRDIMAKYP